ncbi:MAG: hypothetical protein JXR21_00905 [Candidatus Marinimicrobia bacterium]|nr:hypothetical protein [Candidatus Neomarinimicrobiota bacterium]
MLCLPSFRDKDLNAVAPWWPLICIAVNLITLAVLYRIVKKEGRNLRSLLGERKGASSRRKDIPIAIALMLVLGLGGLWGFSTLIYGRMPVDGIQPLPVWAALIVLIFLPLSVVLSELPLYLGYCAAGIRETAGKSRLAIIYPLFFYALQHSFIPLLFDVRHMVSRFLIFVPLLIMIGIWYERKRDLLPLMIGHGVLDLFTGIQLLIVSLDPSIYDMMRSAAG